MKIHLIARAFILMIIIILTMNEIKAQQPTLEWAKIIGHDNGAAIKSYEIDSAGNQYFLAEFLGDIDVDPSLDTKMINCDVNIGGQFVLKLTKEGLFSWVNYFSNSLENQITFSKLKLDKKGNLVLFGWYDGSMDFDLDPTTSTIKTAVSLLGRRYQNSFVTKWDDDGKFMWVSTMVTTNISINQIDYRIKDLAIDSQNNIYFTGRNAKTKDHTNTLAIPIIDFKDANFNDVLNLYLVKLDSEGEFVWLKSDSLDAWPRAMTIDSEDNFLVTGVFGGMSTDFNLDSTKSEILKPYGGQVPFVFDGYLSGDLFCLKMDKSTNFLWSKHIGGDYWSFEGAMIETDLFGNSYILGLYHTGGGGANDFNIDKNMTTMHLTGRGYRFVLKIDPLGNYKWANMLSTPFSYLKYLTVDKCSNLYVVGSTSDFNEEGEPDVNPDTEKEVIAERVKGDYIAKYDTDGNYIWMYQFGESSHPNIMKVDDDNSIHICGISNQTLTDVNPDSTKIDSLQNVAFFNYYFVKLNQEASPFLSLSSSPGEICPGESSIISVSEEGSFTWVPANGVSSNNGKTYTVNPTSTTKYKVQGISNYCLMMDTITIETINVTPTNAGIDTSVCLGDSVVLKAQNFTTANWSTGEKSDSIVVSPLTTTPYIFSTVNNNCNVSDTVVVTVNALPLIETSKDISVLPNMSTVLNASGGDSYLWSPSEGLSCVTCSSPLASPIKATEYCVKVTDSVNCSSSKCVKVSLKITCGDFFIPNSFSPNSDNLNDKLEVKINPECVNDYSFQIFDRWGKRVFESSEISETWDGKFNGQELDNAAFVYYLKVKIVNEKDYIIKKGNVSIIK